MIAVKAPQTILQFRAPFKKLCTVPLVGFQMMDGRLMKWLSGLRIAVGRESAGSSVSGLASLFLDRLSLSRHKA